MPVLFRRLLLAGALFALPLMAQAAPKVVVSIKPIHSLVAALMQGVGEPDLIVKGVASPHTYQMKPSDAARLQDADLVFWVGPALERFLEKPLETLGAKGHIVELDTAPGLIRLATREGGTFEPHDDGDAEELHGEEEYDLHLWLSTANARAMAASIREALGVADPANKAAYDRNFGELDARLDALAAEIKAEIAPVKDKPFIVFHDAYQYFEKEFGMTVAGSITVSPETVPGAARLSDIHAKLATLQGACVFAEPQFEPKLIDVVLEGTDARKGTLDPEGGALDAGPDLYFTLMKGLAGSLVGCLGQ